MGGLHLARVGSGEFTHFEINQDVAPEQAVVENEVNAIMGVVEGEAFLSCFEAEAAAHFEEKFLEMIDYSLFEIGFYIG